MKHDKQIALFEGQKIRRSWHDHEWHYSVVDIVAVLTDSPAPRQYWGVLKGREPQLLTICLQLKLPSTDGKSYIKELGRSIISEKNYLPSSKARRKLK